MKGLGASLLKTLFEGCSTSFTVFDLFSSTVLIDLKRSGFSPIVFGKTGGGTWVKGLGPVDFAAKMPPPPGF